MKIHTILNLFNNRPRLVVVVDAVLEIVTLTVVVVDAVLAEAAITMAAAAVVTTKILASVLILALYHHIIFTR